MFTKAAVGRSWARTLVAVGVITGVACGETDPTEPAGPELPGSISVSTETSGFNKDDSYEVLLDGMGRGTIGAADVMTITELEPATYELGLGDVADNCTVEGTSVSVVSEETADVSLTIVCALSEPDAYTLRFTRDRPDLDTGEMPEWDLYVHFNTSQDPQAVIRQNQATGVEIAHLPGVTLDDLTEEDVASATFGTALVADSFDPGRVILIRTDLGNVYALGNPVEDTFMQTLVFDAVLIQAAAAQPAQSRAR
jgi:hypothetical protein